MLNNRMPGAKKGCNISKSGKCKDCPHYRCMPVDVTDPTTGKIIKQGAEWDCSFSWIMLGAWDAGRQSQGVHAAVAQQTNETIKRQDEFLHLVKGADQRRLPDASGQD